MDPTSNPTPTPTPNPDLGSTPNLPPAPGLDPAHPSGPAPEAPPVPDAGGMAGPIPPVPPASDQVPPVVPGPVTAPTPVNPVINPTGSPNAFQPGATGIAATDPIMTAEPPKAPDPVEEELKAPMVAAGPVPGSIGSAVSGPAGEVNAAQSAAGFGAMNQFGGIATNEKTQNVSFNDPAMMQNPGQEAAATKPGKKLQNKTTLIILIAIAAVVVVVLIVVLIMQLAGGSGSSNPPVSANTSDGTNEQGGSSGSDSGSGSSVENPETLSCTRNMTDDEVILFNDAVSGTISVSAEFEDGELSQVSLVKSVVYSDDDESKNEPVETEVHEAVAEDLTGSSAAVYYLPVNASNKLIYSLDSIQENYEELDFKCELL